MFKIKIYVIRHGQTNWNVKKIIQGRTDTELNEIGIREAKKIADIVSNHKFDLIISSPLKRAKQTAKLVNKDNIQIIEDNRLIERGFGNFEGGSAFDKEKSRKMYNIHINSSENSVEPVNEIVKRISDLFDDIQNKYIDKKILLVTHSGTSRVIDAYFNGSDENGNIATETLKNCEIREYEFKNKEE